MTEKRFENRLNRDIKKFNALNPVWDNEKQDALNVFEMINELNTLHEENEELKLQYKELEISLLNNQLAYIDLEKENEQLKKQIGNLEHTRDFADEVCADCERLENENKQLKKQLRNSIKLIRKDTATIFELEEKIKELKGDVE